MLPWRERPLYATLTYETPILDHFILKNLHLPPRNRVKVGVEVATASLSVNQRDDTAVLAVHHTKEKPAYGPHWSSGVSSTLQQNLPGKMLDYSPLFRQVVVVT